MNNLEILNKAFIDLGYDKEVNSDPNAYIENYTAKLIALIQKARELGYTGLNKVVANSFGIKITGGKLGIILKTRLTR